MTEDESKTLMGVLFFNGDMQELHENMQSSFIYKIIDARIKATFNGEVSTLAKAFVTKLTGGSPGNAVLYTAVLCELSEGGTRPVGVSDLVNAFPFNVPAEAVLMAAWESQKGITRNDRYHDNALDATWAWQDEEA